MSKKGKKKNRTLDIIILTMQMISLKRQSLAPETCH